MRRRAVAFLERTAVPHRRCPKLTSSRFGCRRSISNQSPSVTAMRLLAIVSYLDWGRDNLTSLPRYNSLDRSIVLCTTVKVDSIPLRILALNQGRFGSSATRTLDPVGGRSEVSWEMWGYH